MNKDKTYILGFDPYFQNSSEESQVAVYYMKDGLICYSLKDKNEEYYKNLEVIATYYGIPYKEDK